MRRDRWCPTSLCKKVFGQLFNNLPTAENASSPKFTPLSSPGLVEPSSLGDACAAASCVKQDRIPDLGFIASSATPESGTFDDHTAAVAALPDSYQMHMPEHQLFRHTRLAQYYDFPSEGSSASSGILLGKETNAFPFEEFLSARLSAAAAAAKARPLECTMSINKQTSMVYN
ncbi:hypothetical protein BDZ91DRAFT_766111 [Kalaharituber pfeilii]|nr:hypothetical protein BDZ91DRAFT_766111 [Kalaharituber pfeilii]